MSEDGAGRWQRYGPPASSFSGDFGRRMPRAPEPIWEPSANASREKHATPRVKELLTARWDAPPGNADEFRHEKIEELFKADPDRVIRPAELAAVVVFAPGESVWGTFTTEDAAALFKAIEAHSAVRGVITLAAFVGYVNEVTIHVINERLAGHFMDDKDHGRTISRADFFTLCRSAKLPRKRVTWLWETLDLNGDAQLDFTEFRNFLGQQFLPITLTEKYRAAERRTAHAPI